MRRNVLVLEKLTIVSQVWCVFVVVLKEGLDCRKWLLLTFVSTIL